MISRRTSSALLLSLAFSSLALDAAAHISLDSPKSRYYVNNLADQNKLKNGPCGVSNDTRTTNASLITTFKPGEKVTVRWRETIQHPGFFRIAFDSDGQDFTLPASATNGDGVTILADKIADKSGANNLEYSYEITLPNIECSKCTLQLVQVMTTSPPPYEEGAGKDLYFNCADLVLKADGGSSGGAGGGGAGNAGAAGSGATSGRGSGGAAGTSGNGGMGGANQGGANQGGTSQGGMGQGGANQSGANQGGASANGGASAGQTGSGGNASGGAPGQGGASNGSGGATAAGGATMASGGSGGGSNPPADSGGWSCQMTRSADPRSAALLGAALLAALGRKRGRQRASLRPASRAAISARKKPGART